MTLTPMALPVIPAVEAACGGKTTTPTVVNPS